jgi:hypothetical protein
MSQIIAFEIERTEVVTLDGERTTVRFTKNKNAEEHVVFATNDDGSHRRVCYYSPEATTNIAKMAGLELRNAVHAILQQGS